MATGRQKSIERRAEAKANKSQPSDALKNLSINLAQGSPVDLGNVVAGKSPVPDQSVPSPDEFVPEQFQSFAQEENNNPNATPFDAERQALQNDIARLEEKQANRQTVENEAFAEAGIYDDIQQLNSSKARLQALEDEAIEIRVNGKQALRGRSATKTDFNQLTGQALEDNALGTLAASRSLSRQSAALETNIGIIQSQLKAENDRADFVYEQKTKNLNAIIQAQSDIITEREKTQLEERKQQYELARDNSKANASLRESLMLKLIDQGVDSTQLSKAANGSIEDLLKLTSATGPITNWSSYSPEQAALYLNDDQFKRWETLNDLKTEKSEAAQAAMDRSAMKIEQSISTADAVDSILGNTMGLKLSVGPNKLAREGIAPIFNAFQQGDINNFQAEVKQFFSQETLNQLVAVKERGATLGALSNEEKNLLQDASNSLGLTKVDGQFTGKSNLPEKDFVRKMSLIRSAAMKVAVAESLVGTDAQKKASFQQLSPSTIERTYRERKAAGTLVAPSIGDDFSAELNGGVANVDTGRLLGAIASVESGGNYQAIGPTVQSGLYAGEQALGKYQVMPGNLPEWSREAGFPTAVTPEEFLNNPEIQDRIAFVQFNKNIVRYGTVEDAASIWFTGRPLSEGGNAKDVIGTTGYKYVAMVREAYNKV